MFKKIATDKNFWKKVREDKAYEPLIKRLYELYDAHCREDDIPSAKYSQYKMYFHSGNRYEYETPYFSKRIRLNTLAILCLIYPENSEYLDKLQDTIWAICDEFYWVVPAHTQKYPMTEYDVVDLFSAETAFALSEIKYLLGDRLDEMIKNRIDDEVRKKVLLPYKQSVQRWEKWENNWAAVCAASVGASFMYQAPEEFSEVKSRLAETMECFLAGYKEDGACLEGLAYWEYGFGFYIWYADLLEEFTDGREKLLDNAKVKNIANFAQKIYLTETVTASFSDATTNSRLMVGMCHFLKSVYGEDMQVPPTSLRTDDHCGRWCHHIRSFVFYNEELSKASFDSNAQYFLEDAGWYIKRTPAYSFAIKGGHNAEPHNHNDVGSFILASGDKQLIADLGCGEYTAEYFHPDTRYKILCNSSLGHSVPIINGKAQAVGEEYRGTITPTENSVIVDIKNAYDGQNLLMLKREIEFLEDGISLSDSFEFEENGEYVCRLVSYQMPMVKDNTILIDGLSIEYDSHLWTAKISEASHTTHISAEEIAVYLIDFTPLKKQDSIKLVCRIIQDRI